MREWREWRELGWLDPSSREPLNRDGERDRPQKPPPEYSLTTNDPYEKRVFDDYDEYLREWQAATDNKTIFGPGMRYTRDGGMEQFRGGKWQRIPYAS